MKDEDPDISNPEEVKRFIANARFKPVTADLDGVGEVTFGPITVGVLFGLASVLQIKDPREFALEFTHSLIRSPEIALEEWKSLSDQNLVDVVTILVVNHDGLSPFASTFDVTDPFASLKNSVQSYYDDSKKRWDETFENIRNPLRGLDFSNLIVPLIDSRKVWFASIAPIIESWRETQIGLFSRLSKAIFNLNINLVEYETSIAEVNEIVKKYQWLISPNLPPSFFKSVNEIHRFSSHKRRDMNSLYIDYIMGDNFENAKIMLNRWQTNPLFARRMPILRSVLIVLRNAKKSHNPSHVVIPTLIAQIDGITIDFLLDRGVPRQNGFFIGSNGRSNPETIIKSILSKPDDSGESTGRHIDRYESGTFLWLEVLFQKALPGQPLSIPTTFSRHKIMHGEHTRYGLMANTVRALFILDLLAELDSRIPH